MASKYSIEAVFSAVDKMTAPVRKMAGAVNSFSKSINRDMKQAQMRAEKMGGVLGGLGGFLTAGAIIAFSQKAIQAFGESEAAVANLEAGLKSTNNAIGLSSDQLQGYAKSWQGITIFEDDAIIQNVSAQLLTFGEIGKDNFDRVTKAALDVTSKLKGINATGDDLKSTSIMIGKAMQDPIKGMGAMRRVGISFSKSTESLVKNLVSQGKVSEAQVVMLKEIEGQYGGTAEAIAKTSKGIEKMKMNKFGDMMEEVGKNLVPIKNALIDLAAIVFPKVVKFIDFLVNSPLGNMILAGAAAWKIYETSLVAVAVAQKFFNTLQNDGISKIKILMLVIGAIIGLIIFLKRNWSDMTTTQKAGVIVLGTLITVIGSLVAVIKYAKAIQWAWNIALNANPIGLVVAAIAILIGYIYLLYTNFDKMSKTMKVVMFVLAMMMGPLYAVLFVAVAIVKFFKNNWSKIKVYIQPIIDAFNYFIAKIKTALQPAMTSFSTLLGAIFNLVKVVWGAIGQIIFALFPSLEGALEGTSFFTNLASAMIAVADVIATVVGGIVAVITGMINTATSGINKVTGAVGAVKGFFGVGKGDNEEKRVETARGQAAKSNRQGVSGEVVIRNNSNNNVESRGSRIPQGGSLSLKHSGG